MLSTLVALAVLSAASAYWLRVVGFAIVMPIALVVLGFAFRNEIQTFGEAVVFALVVLVIMQAGYFLGVLTCWALPLRSQNRTVNASKFRLKFIKW
ncbi:hypothetical protein SAMN04488498_1287 [Mesorhizobium albiziae]|uniref:Uncharacterized protein n=1 Tax=Neomesorhizobium albiziae TaxID=335020 RepID=A0A1I4ELJ2_9HYPH|nr:hypothetical protein SAMN04488498_1287 [Mesorhizobium albiziae]